MDLLEKLRLRYMAFQQLLTTGDETVELYITPDFQAIPDAYSGPMSLLELVQEVQRLRVAFPDFGEHLQVVESHVNQDNGTTLVTTYTMTVTTSDTFQSREGQTRPITPDRVLSIHYQDRVTFDSDLKISKVEVLADDMVDIVRKMW